MHYINGKLVFLLHVFSGYPDDLKQLTRYGNYQNMQRADQNGVYFRSLFFSGYVEDRSRKLNELFAEQYFNNAVLPEQSNVVEPAPKYWPFALERKYGVIDERHWESLSWAIVQLWFEKGHYCDWSKNMEFSQ